MMKKIFFSCFIIFCMSFQLSAIAQTDVSFDKQEFLITVKIDNPEAPRSKTLISLMDNKEDISSQNLPIYSYVYETDSSGKLTAVVRLPKNLKSGRCYIYSDSSAFHEIADCLVVNDSDPDTLALKDKIQKCISGAELYDILSDNFAYEKLGLDFAEYDEQLIKTACDACVGEISDIPDLSTDAFISAMGKSLVYARLRHGGDIDIAMQQYASYFNTTYEEFSAYPDDVKDTFAGLFKNFTLGEKKLSDVYTDCMLLSRFYCLQSWGECRDFISENVEYLNIDMGASSDFDEIKSKNQYKVFVEVYSQKEDIDAVEDIKKAFDTVVDNILDEQKKTSSSSSSGSSSFGSASGSSVSVPQSYEQNIPVAPVIENTALFSDIKGHFSEKYVSGLAERGIINGYSDNTFRPDSKVTRAEISKILCLALSLDASDNAQEFDDVASSSWYYEYVTALASKGYVKGYNGSFMPDSTITRQDMAVIISNMISDMQYSVTSDSAVYSDSQSISGYAADAVNIVSSLGIMEGDNNGFRPLDGITRGEASVVISRLIDMMAQNSQKGE